MTYVPGGTGSSNIPGSVSFRLFVEDDSGAMWVDVSLPPDIWGEAELQEMAIAMNATPTMAASGLHASLHRYTASAVSTLEEIWVP